MSELDCGAFENLSATRFVELSRPLHLEPMEPSRQRLIANVRSHLLPGEEIVLVQPQQPWRTLAGGMYTVMFLWGSALLVAMIGGASMLANDARLRVVLGGLALMGLLVGTPIVAARRARGRMFAATGQRLLIVRGAQARSIPASEMRDVQYTEHHGGVGTLRLQHGPEGYVDWEVFRGIDEVALLSRALRLVVSHGDTRTITHAPPFFRREYDEGALGAGQTGCMLLVVLFSLGFVMIAVCGGQWLAALVAFPVIWIFAIIASRSWFGVKQQAVHFLEVTAAGITWCTYRMHMGKPRVQKHEQSVPFAQLQSIAIESPWKSGATQALFVAGTRLVLPAYLLTDQASLVRFVRTVQHYVPGVVVTGDVEMLKAEA